MGSGVLNEVWPSAKTQAVNRVLCRKLQRKKENGQNHTTRGSNQRETKEGCAERIARCGTLSQNGYGDNWSALAGTAKAVLCCRNRTTRGSNQRETKEGCAERIARCGTLSQNGYGDHRSALAGAAEAVPAILPSANGVFRPDGVHGTDSKEAKNASKFLKTSRIDARSKQTSTKRPPNVPCGFRGGVS
jgi:hypothetical protein